MKMKARKKWSQIFKQRVYTYILEPLIDRGVYIGLLVLFGVAITTLATRLLS